MKSPFAPLWQRGVGGICSNALVNAIRTAGEDRAKIREAILATKGYPGVIGTFNFSPDGEGLRAAFAATIQNGEAKLIKPITLD